MRARRVRVRTMVAVTAAVLGLGACRIQSVPRSSGIDPEEIVREEISDVLDAYRDGLLQSDAAAVAATFTSDGELYQPDVPDIIGARDIRIAMEQSFARIKVSDLLLEREQIDILSGGVAWELGRFEETVQAAELPAIELRGRYAIRWRRDPEAQWRMERLLINHSPAADTSASR